MNNDLISRGALVAEFEDYLLICESGGFATASEMLEAVREFPAVDAEPVRHGRWSGNSLDFSCSVCGVYQNIYTGRTNYCPNCGAKMDAEMQQ